MSSRSTTQMSNRAVAHSGTRANGPHAAIVGMCGGAPRIQPWRPGACQQAKQETTAGKGSLRYAKQPRAGKPATGLVRVEVVFYKEILDHRGFPHHCELMRVSGESVELDDAIAGAILEFEQAQCVSHWTIAADGYAVETQPAVV
jgi:hypothetical protein